MRNTEQKITIQSQIMESYVSVSQPHKHHHNHPTSVFDCIKSSFLLFRRHQEKLLELYHSGIRNVIPDVSHLFEQKDRIEDFDNTEHNLKPADMHNISFLMHKCNEKLIIHHIIISMFKNMIIKKNTQKRKFFHSKKMQWE